MTAEVRDRFPQFRPKCLVQHTSATHDEGTTREFKWVCVRACVRSRACVCVCVSQCVCVYARMRVHVCALCALHCTTNRCHVLRDHSLLLFLVQQQVDYLPVAVKGCVDDGVPAPLRGSTG